MKYIVKYYLYANPITLYKKESIIQFPAHVTQLKTGISQWHIKEKT